MKLANESHLQSAAQIFRGIDAAASLKLRFGWRQLVREETIFRGIDAAASLKPTGQAASHRAQAIFRGIDAAASLKPEMDKGRGENPPIFRGIDAAASLKLRNPLCPTPPRPRHLPRHRCRGLIEARATYGANQSSQRIFRGIDAAASLKRAEQAFAPRTFAPSSAASMPRPH